MLIVTSKPFDESYFVASFITGLHEDLQSLVSLFKPHTVSQAVKLVKKQEIIIEAITRKSMAHTKNSYVPYVSPAKKNEPPNPSYTTPKMPNTPNNYKKPLTLAKMIDKTKVLFYNYDEKFVYGHKCKAKSFVLAMTEEEEKLYLQSRFHSFPGNVREVEEMEEGLVSMNEKGV